MTSVSRNIPATSCWVPQVLHGFVVDGVNQPAKPPPTPLKVPTLLGPLHPSTLLSTFIPMYVSSVTWAQGTGWTQCFSRSLSSIYQVFPISQAWCQGLGFSGESAHTAHPWGLCPGHFLLGSHSASIGFQILHPHLHADFQWLIIGCPREPKKWWQEVGPFGED